MAPTRITHRHIAKAVDALNARGGKVYPQIGYVLYQDVRGDGGKFNPGFYEIINSNGGVTSVSRCLRGKTMRDTLAKIEATQ